MLVCHDYEQLRCFVVQGSRIFRRIDADETIILMDELGG